MAVQREKLDRHVRHGSIHEERWGALRDSLAGELDATAAYCSFGSLASAV